MVTTLQVREIPASWNEFFPPPSASTPSGLRAGKSADGLQSLAWFKEGRLDLIEEYCRLDVEVTARLFFLGRTRGYLLYRDYEERLARLPVSW